MDWAERFTKLRRWARGDERAAHKPLLLLYALGEFQRNGDDLAAARVRAEAEVGPILDGCPLADETILVTSELAANAVTHSSSRQRGGRFIVRAKVCPGDYVWVEVEDYGDIWAGHHPRDGRPHGLDIVQAIAGDGSWGVDGDATFGRVAWARLDWPGR
jgi:anti-sigma regulatory factor (Ser/Thr protein kinase)